jgi:hypothetical protein
MLQVKDVESPNSHATIERFLDEIPLTSGSDFRMLCSEGESISYDFRFEQNSNHNKF